MITKSILPKPAPINNDYFNYWFICYCNSLVNNMSTNIPSSKVFKRDILSKQQSETQNIASYSIFELQKQILVPLVSNCWRLNCGALFSPAWHFSTVSVKAGSISCSRLKMNMMIALTSSHKATVETFCVQTEGIVPHWKRTISSRGNRANLKPYFRRPSS